MPNKYKNNLKHSWKQSEGYNTDFCVKCRLLRKETFPIGYVSYAHKPDFLYWYNKEWQDKWKPCIA